MLNKIILVSLLFAAQAHAGVTLDLGKQQGWKFHDLSGEARVSAILSGAVGTIIKPKDRISTVVIYSTDSADASKLGENTADWKKIVIADALDHGGTINKEITFKVGNEWRYYIQSEIKTEDGDKTDVATMALVKNGRLIVFTFQQDPKFFKPRLKSIVNLYFDLKIDKT